jgi:hypothetical protein
MSARTEPEALLGSGLGWLTTSVRVPADARVLVAVVPVAVAADVAGRAGGLGLGGALLFALIAAALLATRPPPTPQGRLLVAAAAVFGLWLFLRTSPWLLVPDVLVAGGLLVLGASLGNRSLLDLTIPQVAARGVQTAAHGLAAPAYVLAAARTLRTRRGLVRRARTRAVLRGILLASPVVLILRILLASADAVFASMFHLDIDPPSALGHAVVILLGAWGMAGLVRAASGSPPGTLPRALRLGCVEAMVVLGLMNALFLAFAIAQLVALSAGGRRVIETAGLTYAEYARSGFFQLLAVAGITLATILALRAVIDHSDRSTRRRFVLLAELTVALTLVIVFVAVRRLGLYADAFGLTMLRLYSTIFSYWIGAVFVLLGLALAGVGRGRSWLPPVAVGIGMAGLLWLNVANPEAIVVRHDVAFAEQTGRFDPAYVADLSDDAIPTLVESLDRLDAGARSLVRGQLCPPRIVRYEGWAAFNAARDRATEALTAACSRSG